METQESCGKIVSLHLPGTAPCWRSYCALSHLLQRAQGGHRGCTPGQGAGIPGDRLRVTGGIPGDRVRASPGTECGNPRDRVRVSPGTGCESLRGPRAASPGTDCRHGWGQVAGTPGGQTAGHCRHPGLHPGTDCRHPWGRAASPCGHPRDRLRVTVGTQGCTPEDRVRIAAGTPGTGCGSLRAAPAQRAHLSNFPFAPARHRPFLHRAAWGSPSRAGQERRSHPGPGSLPGGLGAAAEPGTGRSRGRPLFPIRRRVLPAQQVPALPEEERREGEGGGGAGPRPSRSRPSAGSPQPAGASGRAERRRAEPGCGSRAWGSRAALPRSPHHVGEPRCLHIAPRRLLRVRTGPGDHAERPGLRAAAAAPGAAAAAGRRRRGSVLQRPVQLEGEVRGIPAGPGGAGTAASIAAPPGEDADAEHKRETFPLCCPARERDG